MAHWLRNL